MYYFSKLKKFTLVLCSFIVVKCANIDVKLNVNNYFDDKNLTCCNFKININDINSIDDFFKKIIEYEKDHLNEIQYYDNNDVKIDKIDEKKDLDFIFKNYILESIYVKFSDFVKIDDFSEKSVSFYKNRYNDIFTILKPYFGKIENIELVFKKKHKFTLQCDFDELYNDLNAVISECNKNYRNSNTKGWNDKLDTFLKNNIKEQIIKEINEFKQFFESEDSYHFSSYDNCHVIDPIFFDKNNFFEKGILKNKQICYFCYKFIFFDDIVKVVFDKNLVKKYDYKVILLDTKGNRLNDNATIYNTKKDVFEDTLDGVSQKSSNDISGKFGQIVLKGKTENDNNYFISNIYEIIEDKENKILTIKIDDNRPEFCNFTVINNSGNGLKKCTFLHDISEDYILTKMGISGKYYGRLTKDGNVVSTYERTKDRVGYGVNCRNFKGEYILELFKKKDNNNKEKDNNKEGNNNYKHIERKKCC